MVNRRLHQWIAALLVALCGLGLGAEALADPPTRVARLAYLEGPVSFSPAGEQDWVRARLNRPLIAGDRLWSDAAARAELQLGGAVVRVGENTSLQVLDVADRRLQFDLAQGTLNLHVRHLDRDDALEIDTPNLAYSVTRPGNYRIDVDPDGRFTTITLRSGEAEVFGEGNAFVVVEGRVYRFYGTDLRDYEILGLAPTDSFDRWALARDRRWESSVAARYVPPQMIGYQDLDDYGAWRNEPQYGPVWFPSRVPAGWAPYRDGHWAWIEPWGWTWVDDAPWGFAPSHYGRWAHLDDGWGWVPGPVRTPPVYAPAVVSFVGSNDEHRESGAQTALTIAGIAAVAWFALAPHEVYHPPYPASRDYLSAINTSNTVVNTTNVTNITNVTNVYVNRQVPGAVVAVPVKTFVQAQPVAKTALTVRDATVLRAAVAPTAPIAPMRTSVLGGAGAATRPPANAVARPVVARVAPPAPPPPFDARRAALAAQPGKPLDASATARIRPATPAGAITAPAIKMVSAAARPIPVPPKPASSAAAMRASAAPAARGASTAGQVATAAVPPPAASAVAASPSPSAAERSRTAAASSPAVASADRRTLAGSRDAASAPLASRTTTGQASRTGASAVPDKRTATSSAPSEEGRGRAPGRVEVAHAPSSAPAANNGEAALRSSPRQVPHQANAEQRSARDVPAAAASQAPSLPHAVNAFGAPASAARAAHPPAGRASAPAHTTSASQPGRRDDQVRGERAPEENR